MKFDIKDIEHLEHTKIGDVVVFPDGNVSDIQYRTWKERLFTWPWMPFNKYKSVETGYLLDNQIMIVSRNTYKRIKESGRLR